MKESILPAITLAPEIVHEVAAIPDHRSKGLFFPAGLFKEKFDPVVYINLTREARVILHWVGDLLRTWLTQHNTGSL